MDSQISYRLQREEQVGEKNLNLQPVRQVNHSVQAPFWQNSQYESVGQVRSNRYSGYNQAAKELECKQIGWTTARNRYHEEAPIILQRIEQENSMEHCQTGNSSHQQVALQTILLGSQRQVSHPHYNNHGRRRDLPTHRQGQYNTTRDGQS